MVDVSVAPSPINFPRERILSPDIFHELALLSSFDKLIVLKKHITIPN
jgi:hypothetical protein